VSIEHSLLSGVGRGRSLDNRRVQVWSGEFGIGQSQSCASYAVAGGQPRGWLAKLS